MLIAGTGNIWQGLAGVLISGLAAGSHYQTININSCLVVGSKNQKGQDPVFQFSVYFPKICMCVLFLCHAGLATVGGDHALQISLWLQLLS